LCTRLKLNSIYYTLIYIHGSFSLTQVIHDDLGVHLFMGHSVVLKVVVT